jgi:hypothetical protein
MHALQWHLVYQQYSSRLTPSAGSVVPIPFPEGFLTWNSASNLRRRLGLRVTLPSCALAGDVHVSSMQCGNDATDVPPCIPSSTYDTALVQHTSKLPWPSVIQSMCGASHTYGHAHVKGVRASFVRMMVPNGCMHPGIFCTWEWKCAPEAWQEWCLLIRLDDEIGTTTCNFACRHCVRAS